MTFIVENPQKLRVMKTEWWECVPKQQILRDMSENGFKFTLDGKRITPKEIEKIRQN